MILDTNLLLVRISTFYFKKKLEKKSYVKKTKPFDSIASHPDNANRSRDILGVGPFYSLFFVLFYLYTIRGASAISNDSRWNSSHRYKDSCFRATLTEPMYSTYIRIVCPKYSRCPVKLVNVYVSSLLCNRLASNIIDIFLLFRLN